MYAVRCRGQGRGFRVEGVLYPCQKWLLVSQISEAVCAEPMLEVQTVAGPEDPKLAPFPAAFPDGSERRLPTFEEMAREWERLKGRVDALEKQVLAGSLRSSTGGKQGGRR
ncbi:hypothetical protein [Chthonomonas calidirosea]|uniref:hypothetical protein n=1 Tax=Chthonomonas calidirosea TaxID=454171 RepID=UPI0006EC930B|nr:hypothetical protein [Chthonomonas calidirosea]CEK19949.1 hypothetical protein CP488_02694 [Chthonomonas calidirosea]